MPENPEIRAVEEAELLRMRKNAERHVQTWIEMMCEVTGKESLEVGEEEGMGKDG